MKRLLRRRRFYVNPELQFPLSALLILLVSLEGGLVGWGIYRAVIISQDWFNPHLIRDFSYIVLETIVPIVLVNFGAGIYFSQKIAGPIEKIGRAMGDVAQGRLDQDVTLRDSDFLQAFAEAFNEMTETLRLRQEKENKHLKEARAKLRDLRAHFSSLPEKDRKALEPILSQAESRLSAVLKDETADLGEAAHPL